MFCTILESSEVRSPMRRRQITERQELPLPSLRPDWHSDSPPKKRVTFDSSRLSESLCLAAPISCRIEEPSRCRTRKGAHNTATAQTTEGAGAELVNGKRLFASLLFRRIRPHHGVALEAEASCSFHEPQPGRVRAAAPNVRSPRPRRSRWPATIAQATCPNSLSASIETLFTELAMRRLRSLDAQESLS
jgi:hypothetical protein